MKPRKLLSPAQEAAITFIYEHDYTYLIGQMGSGKSVTAMTALDELRLDGHIERTLIVAPPKVAADVWANQHLDWEHLCGVRVGIANGDAASRELVICGDYDYVVISFNSLPWLFHTFETEHGFDALLIDEVTKLKAGGAFFKALRRRLNDFKVRVVMTGTPVAESLGDLFYAVMACDGGRALGHNKMKFLLRYFYPTDYEQRNWEVRPECVDELIDVVKPMVVELPDYTHELPLLDEQPVMVRLNDASRAAYDTFAKSGELVMDDGTVLVAQSEAVKQGKLEQLACGFVYVTDETDDTRHVYQFGNEKIEAMKRVSATMGSVVYVYQYAVELAALRAVVPIGKQLGVSKAEDRETLKKWRAGELGALFIHPKSAGHGLDLTAGCDMIILSPIWSRDVMRQTVARIWRRGQTKTCRVRVLCAINTVDSEKVEREAGKAEHGVKLKTRLDGGSNPVQTQDRERLNAALARGVRPSKYGHKKGAG